LGVSSMTIVAIDDDPAQVERLRLIFQRMDYPTVEYLSAEDSPQGLDLVRKRVVDLVLTDLRLPTDSGIGVLREVKALNPMIPVVVMTAFSDVREAVEILKQGADDYLVKPTNPEDIKKLTLRIFEKSVLIREAFLPPQTGFASSPEAAGIIYRSERMAKMMQIAARSAESDATVVISGESGTGKELVAHFIHQRSRRRDGPFITVNISALPESLAESELFGHKRGAYTGADADRLGRFELADGGTLFIDEVGDIPPTIQVKLLRTLQFGVIERVGENTPRRLNVRIIAATNRNLKNMVDTGKFRTDLFYRLNVINLELPPLRQRKEDIPPLVDHFIAQYNGRDERSIKGLSREAMDRLMKHDYPGNVRELENIIERSVVLCPRAYITEGDLSLSEGEDFSSPCPDGLDLPYSEAMIRFERSYIEKALATAGGNKSSAARAIGISERHLRSRLQRLYPNGAEFPY